MKLRSVHLAVIIIMVIAAMSLTIIKNGVIANGNQLPVASFTFSPEIPMPEDTIVFNASASYDPDGWIVQYRWDFGDGKTVTTTDPTATYSYPVDGNYTVELTVVDNNSGIGKTTVIVQVNCVAFFRVVYRGSLIPVSDVEVTVYYKNGTAWVKAPTGSSKSEIKYDNMTQPDLADTYAERFRNPGFTASILRSNASNIGFDVHPSTWTVFFKFKWGTFESYWPNGTTRVYNYKNGAIETHDYLSGHQAYWDPSASTYVIKAGDIHGNGVAPTESHPIIVGVLCPPPPQNYYLTVRTDPTGITTIPGQGSYAQYSNVTLTAPTTVNVTSTSRYSFAYWDVNGSSKGNGVNPITVYMNTNHTATAHYVQQYLVAFTQTGLASDASGTVVTINSSAKAFGDLPYSVWVDSGSSFTYSYASTVTSTTTGKRYRQTSMTGPASPFTVSSPVTVAGNYVTQYLVTFAQSGLDSTATGTVVTVNSSTKAYTDLPFNWWVDTGSTVTYSYSSIVSSTTPDKQFRLTGVNCPPSQFIVTEPTTITGYYCIQYLVRFTQSGLDSTATGTVVTVNGSAKTYSSLPYTVWVDSGSSFTYSYASTVTGSSADKQFRLNSVTGPSSPFTVTGPTTVTGNYVVQYLITFSQIGLDSTATGTVVVVNGNAKVMTNLPFTLWVDSGGSVTYAYSAVVSSSTVGKQFRLSGVSGSASPITVTAPTTVTGNYVVQYLVTFSQSGLDSSANGTVVTVNGNAKTYSDLPYAVWVDCGSSVTYSYLSPVSSSTVGKRFRLNSVTGSASPITVTGPTTVTGNYVVQYQVTFSQSGLDSSATGTVVTVNSSVKTYVDLPFVTWIDGGGSVTYSYMSPVLSSYANRQFRLTSITGPTSPITITGPTTITGNYVVQYQVTFAQSGLDSTATGTVVTVNSSSKTYSQLPYSLWVDVGGSVTYSYSSPVSSSTSGKQFRLNSTSGSSSPFTVLAPTTVTGNYVVQYLATFAQSGLDSTATSTVVTVGGNAKVYTDLPFAMWVDSGSSVTYSYSSIVSSSTVGKQFRLSGVSGPTSPIAVTGAVTVTGNYFTQYLVTFAQSGLDSTATGTVVTVNGSGKAFVDLSYSLWADSGSSVTYSYLSPVSSSTVGKRFRLNSVTGSASPITVTGPTTVTGNYVTQYQVIFDQSGVGTDFTGTAMSIDSTNYGVSGLPVSFWWDASFSHTFVFSSPLAVNSSKQYVWSSTSGLSNLQSGSLTVTTSGNVIGNYIIQNSVTFDILGATSDFTGTSLVVDGTNYKISDLPVSFMWQIGSSHTFEFKSPLLVAANVKQYVWTSTSGLSSLQSGSITINAFGNIIGSYKTQYYLTLTTNPTGITTPSGAGWYDSGGYASILTSQYVYGGSRYCFINWTTTDMPEITDPTSPSTTVYMDKAKTVTANYVHQHLVTFMQSGLASDASGTVLTANGSAKTYSALPYSIWVDQGNTINYQYETTVTSTITGKQFILTSITGPSSPITVTSDINLTGNYNTRYYLTVSSQYGTTGGQGWYDSGSTAYAALDTGIVDHGNGTRRIFTYWNSDASGTNFAQSDPISMSGPKTAVANWKTQYIITFTHSGLDSSASSTVVTVNSTPVTFGQLPYSLWVDKSATIAYSCGNVSSSTVGKRFILVGVSGPSSPITVGNPLTVTGNYKTQYQITFSQTGVSSDFTGTIVTVDSTTYTFTTLPTSFWWDVSSSHTFAFSSPLVVTTNGKQYVWTSTTGLSTLQSDSVSISGSGSVVGNYKTQYYLTVSSPYGTPDGQGWYDSSATAYATLNMGVVDQGNGTRRLFTNWSGDASGSNYAQSDPITMNAAKTAVAGWKTQYTVTFAHTSLDSSASSTVVTVNSVPIGFSQLPYSIWVDDGASVVYSCGNVSSSTVGKRFILVGVSGPSSPITVGNPLTVTGNYKTQYQITFSQTGVSSDFTGTIVTVDSTTYTFTTLPTSMWLDNGSTVTFAFNSPLVVNAGKQYVWSSTSGLSTLQSGTLTISGSGSITGTYTIQTKYEITFNQTGIASDFTGTVVIIDGTNYNLANLPHLFWWDSGSSHTFAYQSPLVVTPNVKRYVWVNTTGISNMQGGSIIVSASGAVVGNYDTQYYLTMATNPPGVNSPSGAGWFNTGTLATISTDAFVDIIPGTSRYRFNGWSTGDMTEIANPLTSPTTVLMDKGKTVTANYATQYNVTLNQSGVATDFTGTVVTIDSRDYNVTSLATSFWWDKDSTHNFAFQSPLVATSNIKRYVWTSTTGLSTMQSATISITSSGIITGNYKTQYLLTVLTDPSVLTPQPTRNPTGEAGPANAWWYDSSISVTLTAQPVTGYTFDYWGIDGTSQGSGVNPATAAMNGPHTATAHYKLAVQMAVTINPPSATITLGQSVGFTSNVTGGTPAYTYQWYLDGNPVSGATSSTWTFTPSATGIYFVFLKVTDFNGIAVQSDSARIVVISVPVGGYSVSLAKQSTPRLATYLTLVMLLGAMLSLRKRKKK